jgi:hypothetical protein
MSLIPAAAYAALILARSAAPIPTLKRDTVSLEYMSLVQHIPLYDLIRGSNGHEKR